jgi:hypothetical protein
MSQSGTYEAGNPGALDIQFIQGDAGGPVGPNGGGIIFLESENTLLTFIDGVPGTNTLTITLQGTDQATVQTVDATPNVLLYDLPLDPNSAVSMVCEVIGAQDTYAQVCSGIVQCSARRVGGGAILVGAPLYLNTSDNFALADFGIRVSGNNMQLVVLGEAATTINWSAIIRFNVIDL